MRVGTDTDARDMHMTRSVSAAFVLLSAMHTLIYTARLSLHQVHGSQCTKKYYAKYSWRTLADVCMVSEVLRIVPCYCGLLQIPFSGLGCALQADSDKVPSIVP